MTRACLTLALATGAGVGCSGSIADSPSSETGGQNPDDTDKGSSTTPPKPGDTKTTPDDKTPVPTPLSGGTDLRKIAAGAADTGGPATLRGLTRVEYNNTIAALLGDTSAPASSWGAEVKGDSGFLEPRPVSGKEIKEYMDAAQTLAAKAKPNLGKLLGCDPKTGEDACAASFVTTFGRRAFRRPLLAEEQTGYVGLYTEARKTQGLSFEDSVSLIIEAMLQSPSFMYHWELGPQKATADKASGLVRLTGYELAARLSYFLTQSPPDEALSAAADSGAILQATELAAHAKRLMATDKAKEILQDWVAQLFDVMDFDTADDATQRALAMGRRAFVEKTLWSGKGTFNDLLLNTEFPVNATTSKIYGMTGVTGDAFVAKTIDPMKRFGMLTQGDFLARTGKGSESLPPRRGKAIWQNVLCGDFPSDVPPVPPEIERDPAMTTREHFEKKVEPIACASACHKIVDQAGYAFESYAGPVWRDKDQPTGKTIDASGALTLPFGGTLAYGGTKEFVDKLAGTEEVRQCVTRQMFRLAVGRSESTNDAGSLKALYDAFITGKEDVKTLAASVVSMKAFSYRRPSAGEVVQ